MKAFLFLLITSFILTQDYALEFDGVDDCISISMNPSLQFDLNESFTLEAWVSSDFYHYETGNIIRAQGGAGLYGVRAYAGGTVGLLYRDNNWVSGGGVGSTSIITDGLFHHVACVRDMSSNTSRIYIDGKLESENPDLATTNIYPPGSLHLGCYEGWNEYFGGIIEEVRISNTARYVEDFTPEVHMSTDNYTSGLWHFNEGSGNTVFDLSNNNNHGTITGASWVNSSIVFGCVDELACNYDENATYHDDSCEYSCHDNGEYSLSFNGNSWVEIPYNEDLNSEEFTYSFYVKRDFDTGGEQSPITSRANPYKGFMSYSQYNKWAFAVGEGVDWNGIHSDHEIIDDNWYYVVMTYDGADIKMYIDGVLQTETETINFVQNNSRPLRIGAGVTESDNPTAYYFNGDIDNISIWSRALSLEEVNTYMQNGVEGGDAELKGFWKFNQGPEQEYSGILIDHSGNQNHGTIHGAEWIENIEGCMDSSACNFNEEATHDDESCWYGGIDNDYCDCQMNVVDDCGVCGGPGSIYECGCNSISDLYPGFNSNQYHISGGRDHTIAVDSYQKVVAWGYNNYGQCDVPEDLEDVIAISAGWDHNLALTANRQVVAWGLNDYGQCDVPENLDNVISIAAGRSHSLALKSNGEVVAWGLNDYGQCDVPEELNDVVDIDLDDTHNVALKSDGTVVAWGGDNGWGELDIPSNLEGVVDIDTGGEFVLALKSDGELVGWGENYWGQLNTPSDLDSIVAISGGGSHSIALMANGQIGIWGFNNHNQVNLPEGLEDVVAVSAGVDHSIALQSNGNIVAWGGSVFSETDVPENLEGLISFDACNCSGDIEDYCGECAGDDSSCTGCMDQLADNYSELNLIEDNSCLYTASYSLHSGNNLVSFLSLPENTSVENVLSSVSGNASQIIGEGEASTVFNGQWVGSLNNIDLLSGYWVKMDTLGNILITTNERPGHPGLEYTLHQGNNLISFPFNGSYDINTVFPQNAIWAINGIIGEGVAASNLNGQFIGSLSYLEGGKGYWFKTTEPVNFQFENPADSVLFGPSQKILNKSESK